jgi:ABC-type Fe3+/spermidine/putrescine transport system ATPase subunit
MATGRDCRVKRVEIQDISVRYGATWAVRDVTLTIEPGEIFFLLGPSGCGKTTLLRAVAGLSKPAMGEILIDGRPMNTVLPHQRGIGFVFQNYALWPHMTVEENVAYGLVTRKVGAEAIATRVETALGMLGLAGLGKRHPGELSGGQQQRVAVARAIVIEPDVLLMDEPLSNLDAQLRAEMRRELKALIRRLGVTTIYVTHDQREALSMADRVAVMRDGQIVQCGAPEDLYSNPSSEFIAAFVGEANAIEGEVIGLADDGFKVKTEVGVLRGVAEGTFRQGDSVRVLVRPEDVTVGIAINDDNLLPGSVVDIAFLGGFEEVLVDLGHGLRIRSLRARAAAPAFELGEGVEVAFAAERSKVFGDGEVEVEE